jgi:hypothetical protein
MKLRSHRSAGSRPQLIEERKPVRPVHVADARQPIKVTKPIAFGADLVPARRAR